MIGRSPSGVGAVQHAAQGQTAGSGPSPQPMQVANLARTLVARWKAITIASSSKNSTTIVAVAAAATRGNSGAIEGATASASGTSPAHASRGAAAVDETLRGKVRSLLEGSLRSHVEAVARLRNRDVDVSDVDPEQLGLLARNLELAVFKAHGRDGACWGVSRGEVRAVQVMLGCSQMAG